MDKIIGFFKPKERPMEQILKLDDVIVDNDLNPRDGALDQDVVLDYSAHVDDLPPMVAFDIQGFYFLAGGFHRYAAHRLALRDSGRFIVHQGDRNEAKEFADLDNLKHGLRLNRAERRRVIERQLKRHTEWSDSRLALACYTTDKTVRAIREALEETSEIPRLDVLVGADGIERPRTIAPRRETEADPPQPTFESAQPIAPALLRPVEEMEAEQDTKLIWVYNAGTEHGCFLCDRAPGSGVYHWLNYHLCWWCYRDNEKGFATHKTVESLIEGLKRLDQAHIKPEADRYAITTDPAPWEMSAEQAAAGLARLEADLKAVEIPGVEETMEGEPAEGERLGGFIEDDDAGESLADEAEVDGVAAAFAEGIREGFEEAQGEAETLEHQVVVDARPLASNVPVGMGDLAGELPGVSDPGSLPVPAPVAPPNPPPPPPPASVPAMWMITVSWRPGGPLPLVTLGCGGEQRQTMPADVAAALHAVIEARTEVAVIEPAEVKDVPVETPDWLIAK